MRPNAKRYTYPQEIWDKKKCEKLCKYVHKDGIGTKYAFKGYIGHLIGTTQDFNGGTIIDGEWYQGVIYQLPIIPKEFEIYNKSSWGYCIRKKA